MLGYFKYNNFLINTANQLVGSHWALTDIMLPLGISFFTFTQIAFLVDVYRGIAREYNFVHYMLFVTYFPHLIAGPVLHHKQMMPQFKLPTTYKFNFRNLNIGLTIFTIGLFKKVAFADQFALFANPIFDTAAGGGHLQLFEAWVGALAYTLQLYFDFSGYSDMAIGVSRMFNVKLPLNFNSPYKATNIIEFWRRWHMTLSTFLRDYLYIPLGGNRLGVSRRYLNLFATMLLGGLWHGANWTFVIWGGLHGIYLTINHAWQGFCLKYRIPHIPGGGIIAGMITFVAVVVAWVPFRASNLDTTIRILRSMAGMNGVTLSSNIEKIAPWLSNFGITFNGLITLTVVQTPKILFWLPLGFIVVWTFPNIQQWLVDENNIGVRSSNRFELPKWMPTKKFAVLVGLLLGISLIMITRASQFLYFQF